MYDCSHQMSLIREGRPAGAGTDWYSESKRAIDLILAILLLVPTAPLMLIALLLVKLSSRGPAIYTQTRVGLGGREFVIYKVRTMRYNCEKATGPRWAEKRDSRVTRVGSFLRRTHLDELPQLFNVLRGDMTLVGPRPERPEFVSKLEQAIPCYRDRLSIRPGVTGLAQVLLPPDVDVQSVRTKLTYDLFYLRHVGFWFDLKIIGCTLLKVVGLPNALKRNLLGVPDHDSIEGSYEDLVSRTTRDFPIEVGEMQAAF